MCRMAATVGWTEALCQLLWVRLPGAVTDGGLAGTNSPATSSGNALETRTRIAPTPIIKMVRNPPRAIALWHRNLLCSPQTP